MRRILVTTSAVIIGTVVASSPLAQAPDLRGVTPAVSPKPAASVAPKVVPPPPVLPNIRTLATRLIRSDREVAQRQLASSKKVVAFFEQPSRVWMRALNHEKCWEVPWQRTCTVARHAYRLHLTLQIAAQRKLYRELPYTNDWQTAVRIAQRAYPGTASWMLSISDREGGWGRWVWYSGVCGSPPCLWHGYHVGHDSTGDTVGGWMQFRWSTFAPYWRGAVKDLRKRGFLIPDIPMPPEGGDPQYAPWLNALGQALTAGYMRYYGKDGCHWCL